MTSETKNCLRNLLLPAGLVGEVALNVHADREVPDNEITTARLAPSSNKRELAALFTEYRSECRSRSHVVDARLIRVGRFNPEGKGREILPIAQSRFLG